MAESLYSSSPYLLILTIVGLALSFYFTTLMAKRMTVQQIPKPLNKMMRFNIMWNFCSLLGIILFSGDIEPGTTSYNMRQVLFGIQALIWTRVGMACYEIGETVTFSKFPTFRRISNIASSILVVGLTALFIIDPEFLQSFDLFDFQLIHTNPIFIAFSVLYIFFLLPVLIANIYQLLRGSMQAMDQPLAQTGKYMAGTFAAIISIAFIFDFAIPLTLNMETWLGPFHFMFWHQLLTIFLAFLCGQYYSSISFKNKSSLWFLRKLISKMEDGIVYYDDNGRINYANQGAAKLLALSTESLIGKSIRSVFPPNLNFFSEVVYDDIQMDLNGERHSFKIHFFKIRQTMVTTINIAYFVDQSKTLLLQKDLRALNEQYMEFSHDIARYQDRLNKEARIKSEKENVLNTLINALPFRVWYKNELGVYQKQNQQDLEKQGSVEGTNTPPENVTAYERNARENGEAGVYTSYVNKDGEEVSQDEANRLIKNGELIQTFDNMYIPILQGKPPFKTLCIMVDITKQRRLEQERNMLREQKFIHSRLEELGTMCGAFAHDYNNILGSQIGFCQLAQETLPEGHQANMFIAEALKAAQRGKTSLEELLDAIRGNAKSATPAIVICPYMIIEDVVKKLTLTLPPNIALNSTEMDHNVKIRGVVASLDRIISNMANNAIFAMKETGGTLTFQLLREDLEEQLISPFAPPIPPGNYAKIVISDTGTGMDSGTLERIFAPFFTTKAPGEGLGLGLSSALRLLKEGNAYFTVQTTLGKGTTFNLYWPVETESKEN
ncbi:MAG: PAS domain S-box protein [Fibrobacter sp.]|nr:PAS domain S-box protein [Fibrobacter sp.]